MNGLKWVRCMELFVEQKNKNYGAVYDLLMEIKNKSDETMTSTEISDFILKRGLYTPYFERSLMNKCKEDRENLHVLKEVSKNVYTIAEDTFFPPPVLNIEMVYLKHILNDDRMHIFLDNLSIEKLKGLLKTYDDFQIGKYIEIKGKSESSCDYKKLNKVFLLFLKSRKEKRIIKYNYVTRNGQIFEENFMLPYKIEYSIRDDKFYLIYYSIEQNRMNKGIIENFHGMKLDSIYEDYELIWNNISYVIERQKVKYPIIIEVKDRKNAVERAFYLLSCFKKRAYYDKERNVHIIYIYYYEYDEAEIISRILSLGKNAKVISPENIKTKIIQRIKKAVNLYD